MKILLSSPHVPRSLKHANASTIYHLSPHSLDHKSRNLKPKLFPFERIFFHAYHKSWKKKKKKKDQLESFASVNPMPSKFPWFRRGWSEFIGRRKTREPVAKLFDSRGREARTIVADDNHLVVGTTRRSDFRGEKRGGSVRRGRKFAAKHPGRVGWKFV